MITVDSSKSSLLTSFSKKTLERYMSAEEYQQYLISSNKNQYFQNIFARVAKKYANDSEHAQRLYNYISNLWFMPATPILLNGGLERGLPISCFLNTVQDSLESIVQKWEENTWISSKGGGIGTSWSLVRAINDPIGSIGPSAGVIPFIKVQDSLSLAISQGALRRGSSSAYLHISHPDIINFIDIRRPSGGDINRKALHIHHGVVISDNFMHAVEKNEDWNLISPYTKKIVDTVKARELWIKLLTVRIDTGEPYFLFEDTVNKSIHEAHKKLNLKVHMSNLCSEITLFSGIDHLNKDRTAVCCLSSLNLELYEEWQDNSQFIEDILYFLDNVLDDFIKEAPHYLKSAIYSVIRERSIGLGVMGFHYYLQKNNIVFDSLIAKIHNKKIFKNIHEKVLLGAKNITKIRGSCPDAIEAGIEDRFINKMAIAPTASIAIICGQTSPSIEPIVSNAYTSKTLNGSFPIKNRYLEKLIEAKGLEDDVVWKDIISNNGSIQDLSYFSDHEKEVFKTAYEIDQRSIVDMAADRTPFICQSQSINLFFYADVHKSYLHEVHYSAWKKGVKSLYYARSLSLTRPENIEFSKKDIQLSLNSNDKYDECLSCQ